LKADFMAHPAGEAETGDLRVDFDRRLRLERHGAAESANTPKSGCAMPSNTAFSTRIDLRLGTIWEMSV